MKRPVLFLFLITAIWFLCEVQADAQRLWKQRRFETSVGLGPSFFFGDVGGFSRTENVLGFKDLTFLQTRYNVNLNVKYRITTDLNARLSLTSAALRATDERGSNEGRAFESRINIFEPALLGEFYFIKNKTEGSYLFQKGRQKALQRLISTLDIYAFTGIGGVNYSVKGNDKLTQKDLTTSGFSAVIPVGFGAHMIYSADFNFGIEIGGRYSFTDYLDGYTSQYSSANDVYYFLNFTVTYKMRTNSKGLPTFRF